LFLDDTQPESLVVAATNHPALLDMALFRRFDGVIAYALPDSTQSLDVLAPSPYAVNTSAVSWGEVANHVSELSQAELVRAAESAANEQFSTEARRSARCLVVSLDERRTARRG